MSYLAAYIQHGKLALGVYPGVEPHELGLGTGSYEVESDCGLILVWVELLKQVTGLLVDFKAPHLIVDLSKESKKIL